MKRISYDTSIKHITRHGLLQDILTREEIALIPSSNISRWKHESDNKYMHSEINEILKQEVDLIRRLNQSSNIKKINQSYFKLADTFHEIISKIKGVKSLIKNRKELVINTIETIKNIVPIDTALKIFNISRSTFENYKSIVIHKCESAYFHWCSRRFPNQLLPKEITTIKSYMENENYKHWSKASIYLIALRDRNLHCCMSTFYKYCRLLGFKNKPRNKKSDDYNPVRTSKPNELWCADVTIFKTADNVKHCIHFLIDHYSKMILGYDIEKSSSATTIKTLIQKAFIKYKPDKLLFLTDGGSENVNGIVSEFINSSDIPIQHIIAQKDVVFSNSMIEALNKTIKHQFLYHHQITTKKQLKTILEKTILIYNTIRPQMGLGGNTPLETFNGISIELSRYTSGFGERKTLRKQVNKQNACKVCF